MLFLFANHTLDTERRELHRGSEPIAIEPQVFDLLVCLMQNRGRVVSKDDLIASVWGGRIVSDSTLTSRINAARKAVGDSGDQQSLIRTIARRGFRFVGTVGEQKGSEAVSTETSPIVASPPSRSQPRRTVSLAAVAAVSLVLVIAVGASFVPRRGAGQHAVAAIAPGSSIARHVFKDCDRCPDMVALPAGTFLMGSPADEPHRAQVEGEPRQVAIERPFAIGRFEVTVDQYALFLEATRTAASTECRFIPLEAGVVQNIVSEPGPGSEIHIENNAVRWERAEASFRKQPGYVVTGAHPAGCISRIEAESFVAWLRMRTGKPYRLPTESEWEYAARAGTTTPYSFGNDERLLCDYARFSDLGSEFSWGGACRSGKNGRGALPVGSLKPNGWGLFDMHGNVWEWVADCWTPDPEQIPTDGSAVVIAGQCEVGVIRGGSFAASYPRVRSAFRLGMVVVQRDQNIGFRVALSL